MEDKWAVIEMCVTEMLDAELSMEEREFAMQRALSIINSLREYYCSL